MFAAEAYRAVTFTNNTGMNLANVKCDQSTIGIALTAKDIGVYFNILAVAGLNVSNFSTITFKIVSASFQSGWAERICDCVLGNACLCQAMKIRFVHEVNYGYPEVQC